MYFIVAPIIVFFTSFSQAHNFSRLDLMIDTAIAEHIFPEAVVLIGYENNIIYHKAFGHYTYDSSSSAITTETLFDIASLTKVVATTPAAMILCDRGLLCVDDLVMDYFPTFGCYHKEHIRIKDLLTHTSGLSAGVAFGAPDEQPYEIIEELLHQQLMYPTGVQCVYSCMGMIMVQKIIEHVSGMPLDQFVDTEILKPLAMHATMFNPHNKHTCAPTTLTLQGIVHDEKACWLGGVAGNAGLFATASDLARFMCMMLNDGLYQTSDKSYKQLIKSETVQTWAQRQCPFSRGYGWEIGRHLFEIMHLAISAGREHQCGLIRIKIFFVFY